MKGFWSSTPYVGNGDRVFEVSEMEVCSAWKVEFGQLLIRSGRKGCDLQATTNRHLLRQISGRKRQHGGPSFYLKVR